MKAISIYQYTERWAVMWLGEGDAPLAKYFDTFEEASRFVEGELL